MGTFLDQFDYCEANAQKPQVEMPRALGVSVPLLNKTNPVGFFQKLLTPWPSMGLTFSSPLLPLSLPTLPGREGGTQ